MLRCVVPNETSHTFCKTCNRVVWTKDVDEDGNCVDCQDQKPKSKPKPEK